MATENTVEVIGGVELEHGQKVFYCTECGKAGNRKHLSRGVISIKHKHPSAHKAQKHVRLKIQFLSVEKDCMPCLCVHCQQLVISGVSNGGMFE